MRTLADIYVSDLTTSEASQPRVFDPSATQYLRVTQRPLEPSAESALHGRAQGRCHPLLPTSFRLRQPAATNRRDRDRLYSPGPRGTVLLCPT